MNDFGTTASAQQVSPNVEEQEMSKVRDVFDRALNAIMEQSKLAQEVASLRESVQGMQRDLEALRERNRSLDELLAATRKQRDEAYAEAAALRIDLQTTKTQLEHATQDVQSTRATLDRVSEERDAARKERDDTHFRVLELEEERNALKAKLDAIQAALGLPKTPEVIKPDPIPEPQPEHPVQTAGESLSPQTGEPARGYW